MLFSVVIPVYNAERYLIKCLKSVIDQSFTEFEVVIVDDGSTDASGEICDYFASEDSRIHVIHQANKGQTYARGVGCKASIGDYIIFVDSDDWLETNELMVLSKHIENNSSDMVFFDFYSHSEDGKSFLNVNREQLNEANQVSKSRLINDILFDQRCSLGEVSIYPSLWSKVFKRELILDNYGTVDSRITVGEDLALVVQCTLVASKLSFCHEALYNYRLLPDSVYHRYNPKAISNLNYLYENLSKMLENNEDKNYVNSLRCYFFRELWNIIRRILASDSYEKIPEQLAKADKKMMTEIDLAIFKGRSVKEKVLISLIRTRRWRIIQWLYFATKVVGDNKRDRQ